MYASRAVLKSVGESAFRIKPEAYSELPSDW